MESGIVDQLFSFEELVGIVDEWETARDRIVSKAGTLLRCHQLLRLKLHQ